MGIRLLERGVSLEGCITYSDLVRFTDIKEGDRVLDVGCGVCPLYFWEKGVEYDLVGLDTSREMLQNARSCNEGRDILFIQGRAENLPFGNNQFDAVISYNLLNNLQIALGLLSDPVKAIKEMARVLKPGKKLAIVPIHETGSDTYTKGIANTLRGLGFHDVTRDGKRLYVYGTKHV